MTMRMCVMANKMIEADVHSDFFEESRVQKIKRRLIEEPLIPLGCALTVWALLEATKSIRSAMIHMRLRNRSCNATGLATRSRQTACSVAGYMHRVSHY